MRVKRSFHPRYSHEVVWHEGGRRQRVWKSGKQAADDLASEVRLRLQHLPPAEAGIDRAETQAVLRARELKVPLMAAVEAYAAGAAMRARSITVAELVERRKAEMARRTSNMPKETRHFIERRRSLKSIAESWGPRPLCDITREDAERWVYREGGKAALTIRNRRTVLVSLFAFAIGLRVIDRNVAEEVPLPARDTAGAIGILTPAEAREYLLACRATSPGLLALEAVRMFAGLRLAEANRLDWEEINLQRHKPFIAVTAGKSKTKTRRLVDVQPALRAILTPLAKESGRLLPKNARKLRDRAMKAAGWKGDKHGVGTAAPDARKWPDNALRHSFVSYHVAMFKDLALTELQAGHDKKIIFSNYRELVTAKAAREFWGIRL